MPKPSLDQNVAISIVDFIYFYDVMSIRRFKNTREGEQFYKDMNDEIDNILINRDKTELDAMLYKHFLLCGLEIYASFTDEVKEEIDQKVDNIGEKKSYIICMKHLFLGCFMNLKNKG